jgi:hypothetical protein
MKLSDRTDSFFDHEIEWNRMNAMMILKRQRDCRILLCHNQHPLAAIIGLPDRCAIPVLLSRIKSPDNSGRTKVDSRGEGF